MVSNNSKGRRVTFFFMYHPNSVAWLPAPVRIDKTVKKRKKLSVKERMKLRRKKQLEEILLLLEVLDDE